MRARCPRAARRNRSPSIRRAARAASRRSADSRRARPRGRRARARMNASTSAPGTRRTNCSACTPANRCAESSAAAWWRNSGRERSGRLADERLEAVEEVDVALDAPLDQARGEVGLVGEFGARLAVDLPPHQEPGGNAHHHAEGEGDEGDGSRPEGRFSIGVADPFAYKIRPFARIFARVPDRPEIRRHLGGHPRAHPRGRAPRRALREGRPPGGGRGLGHVRRDQPPDRPGQGASAPTRPARARRDRLHRRAGHHRRCWRWRCTSWA